MKYEITYTSGVVVLAQVRQSGNLGLLEGGGPARLVQHHAAGDGHVNRQQVELGTVLAGLVPQLVPAAVVTPAGLKIIN